MAAHMPNFSSVAEVARDTAIERGRRGQLIETIQPGEWRSVAALAYLSADELHSVAFAFPREHTYQSSSEGPSANIRG